MGGQAEDKVGDQAGDKANTVGDIVGDKLGRKLGDKVGSKVPRFRNPAHAGGKGGSRDTTTLLLEIETQQLSPVGSCDIFHIISCHIMSNQSTQ